MRKGYTCYEPKQMPAFYPWKAEGQCLLSTPGRGGDAPPPSPILLEMVCGYTMVQVLQAVHVVDKHCW